MMINKRLIGTVSESKKYVAGNVAFQWCSLAANMVMMTALTSLLAALYEGSAGSGRLWGTGLVALAAVAVRFACTVGASRMGYLSSKAVKKTLREQIYSKLLRLGASYKEQVSTSRWCRWRWRAWTSWKPILVRICPSFSTPCWPR